MIFFFLPSVLDLVAQSIQMLLFTLPPPPSRATGAENFRADLVDEPRLRPQPTSKQINLSPREFKTQHSTSQR